MSICLFVATCAAIMFVVWCLDRRCERMAGWARSAVLKTGDASSVEPPRDLFYHAGHTWTRVHDDQLVTIGATAFAANFIGATGGIEVPKEQHRLKSGDVAWTLVAERGRRLSQTIRIEGKLLAINTDLLDDPELVQRSTYQDGWILRVRPRDLVRAIHHLLPLLAGRAWANAVAQEVNERLEPIIGFEPHDGTNWTIGFGDCLDTSLWDEIERDMFAAVEPRELGTHADDQDDLNQLSIP